MDYHPVSASTSPSLSEHGKLFWQPQEFKLLSWMFKSSWSSFNSLERFVSTLVTGIFQSPYYVMQLSVKDSSRSLYISSALLRRILNITFGIRLPCHPLPCCEGNELKVVQSCVEVLLQADLALGGQTNLKAPSPIFTYTRPSNSPNFSVKQEKPSHLPALIPAPHREKEPCLTARRGKEKVPGRGEHIWNPLQNTECLGKNCRAGRNHSKEPRVRAWLWSKGGGPDVSSILKHKTRAPLEALFFNASSKTSQPRHIFTATGLLWVGSEFSTGDRGCGAAAPAEANRTHMWLEHQHSVTQRQYYIKLLSGCWGGGNLWLTWHTLENRNLMV